MAKKITIKVAPDVLRSKSSEIQSEVNSIRQSYEGIRSILSASKGYWIGSAGNKHHSAYKKIDAEIESTIKHLGEHPTDLLKMADLYIEGEDKAQSLAKSIQADVIV